MTNVSSEPNENTRTLSPINDDNPKTLDNNVNFNNLTTSITFVDVPHHTETALGTSVLLACRTSHPVEDCQWSWRPLPPVNLPLPDDNSPQNSNETTSEATVSPAATTQSVPVRLFSAFGNNSNDCSVRFTHTKYEQIGYWTCAVRISSNDTFVSTEPAMLKIASDIDGLLSLFLLNTHYSHHIIAFNDLFIFVNSNIN